MIPRHFRALWRCRSRGFLTVLLLAVHALQAAPPVLLPKQNWFAAESAHFRFVTDCSERRTRAFASDLETLRQVLSQITPGLRSGRYSLQSPLPTYVYLFDSGRDFDAHAGEPGWAGFFQRRSHGNYVALSAGLGHGRRTVFHEYIHYFVANNFPGTPSWANEGLAEFYSMMVLNGQEVVLGRPFDGGHLGTLTNQQPLPMATLAGLDWSLHEGTDEPTRRLYYASVWMTVHYLLLGNPERRPQLGAFLELIRAGLPSDEAFRQAFRCEPAALDPELRAYRNQFSTHFQSMTISLGKLEVANQFAYSPLPRPEALARLGVLAANGDPRKKDFALAHFQAALADNPTCGSAHFGLGVLACYEHRFTDAAAAFDMAAKQIPDDPQIHLQAGRALYAAGTQSGVDFSPGAVIRPEFAQARAHLTRCLELDPTQGEATEVLQRCCEMDPKGAAESLPLLEQALQRTPQRFDLKLSLATLFEAAGQPERSRALLKELAAQDVQPAIAQSARLKLLALADQHARKLFQSGVEALKEGKKEEGKKWMADALNEASPALKQELETKRNKASERPIITFTGGMKTPPKKAKTP